MKLTAECPRTFFTTREFAVAWYAYLQWLGYQSLLGRNNEVKLAGCRTNDHNCWEVLITQAMHDDCLHLVHNQP